MPIKITFHHTSRLSMRITKDLQVHVSAPIGVSKEQVEAFVQENQEWIRKALQSKQVALQQKDKFYSRLPLVSRKEVNEASARLIEKIRPWLEHYQRTMKVSFHTLVCTSTRSRWGSCHPAKKEIRLSVYLLLLPDWCIEHVVAHELTHLLVPNHGPKFYATLSQYFPRWKEARKETRRILKMGDGEEG